MKVDLEIQYPASTLFRDHTRYGEAVEIELREEDDEGAPIAVRWNRGETRWHDGRHYRRITDFGDAFQSEGEGGALSTFFQNLKTKHGACTYPYLGRQYSRTWRYSASRHPEATNAPERLHMIERARTFAKDCIVVHGELWMKCGEPRLVLMASSRDKSAVVTVQTGEWTIASSAIGIDIRTPSLEVAAHSFQICPTEEERLDILRLGALKLPSLSVPIPQSLLRDPFADMLREAAEALIHYRSRQLYGIGDIVLEQIEVLRRHLFPKGGNAILDLDYLANVLALCRDNIQDEHSEKKEHLQTILCRWDDRPIICDWTV